MRGTRKPKQRLPLIVVFALFVCAHCLAQTTSQPIVEQSHASPAAQDSQTLRALEIANIRLSAANDTIALLNERLKEKDAVIAALDAKDSVKTEMINLLKSANKDRATVNNGDARMLESCNLQLSRAEIRIQKLEHPGFLHSVFDVRSASGFMVGYGVRAAQGSFTK